MSEDGKQNVSARPRRVQMLKRAIVFTLLILLWTPIVCCAVMLFKIRGMSHKIDELAERLAILEQSARMRTALPDSMRRPVRMYAGVGQGSVAEAGAMLSEKRDEAADHLSGEEFSQAAGSEENTAENIRHRVYLTFDDGPSIYTDDILDILAEYDVKATFFVVGKEDDDSKEALLRTVEEGHTLGMHSYSHKYSELYASLESFEADFDRQHDYLEELTGVSCKFYRFPGGSSNTVSKEDMHVFADYLDARGVVFYDWNVSSGDGSRKRLSVGTLVENSTSDLERWKTSIILLHDSADKRTTVEALPQIIEKILAMEDTAILPITDDTVPVQHVH